MVDLARFERATSTFAESRSHSPELQVRDCSGGERVALTATSAVARSHRRSLAEAAGLEAAHATRGDLANRCHSIRRRLHRLAEGTGLEPASDMRGSFRDYCLTS